MKSKILLATATAAIMLTAACGSGSKSAATATGAATTGSGAPAAGAGSLIIGSADFSENTILAYVYGQALAAKGVKVSYKTNIGERAVYMQALKEGSIDMIPEYSGSILATLDKTATATKPDDVAAALKTAAAGIGLTELNYAPAQDA